MRTLWVCAVAGGPFQYAGTTPGSTLLGLEEAHRELQITSEEFDEVAAELARSLDTFKVPEREKGEVLAAFAVHKSEVTEGRWPPRRADQTALIAGAFLMLLVTITDVGNGVLFFPILENHGKRTAVVYVAAIVVHD